MIDDDWYINQDGQRVLLGLSFEETEEFVQLDALVLKLMSDPKAFSAEEERRWSQLFSKHEAARSCALSIPKTQR